jgi:hypothetical protein
MNKKEYQREWARNYRKQNREKVNRLAKESRDRKQNQMTEEDLSIARKAKADYDKQYRAKNKDKIKEYFKKYNRKHHLPRLTDPIERFMLKVRVDDVSGCWLWEGVVNKDNGYGSFCYNKKTTRAHRFSYSVFVEEIPAGMEVCHSCDNILCVNPTHLFAGTHTDNMKDMVRKGRSPRGENSAKAKLTEKDVLYIRSSTEKQKTLADKYGVSISTIWSIRTRKTWGHLL